MGEVKLIKKLASMRKNWSLKEVDKMYNRYRRVSFGSTSEEISAIASLFNMAVKRKREDEDILPFEGSFAKRVCPELREHLGRSKYFYDHAGSVDAIIGSGSLKSKVHRGGSTNPLDRVRVMIAWYDREIKLIDAELPDMHAKACKEMNEINHADAAQGKGPGRVSPVLSIICNYAKELRQLRDIYVIEKRRLEEYLRSQ